MSAFKYFVTYGQTTNTRSTQLGATLQRAGRTVTASLGAQLLRPTIINATTFSLGAVLAAPPTATTSVASATAGAIISKAALVKTAQLDGVLSTLPRPTDRTMIVGYETRTAVAI